MAVPALSPDTIPLAQISIAYGTNVETGAQELRYAFAGSNQDVVWMLEREAHVHGGGRRD